VRRAVEVGRRVAKEDKRDAGDEMLDDSFPHWQAKGDEIACSPKHHSIYPSFYISQIKIQVPYI
jgi:hypothetical protein